MGGHTHRGLLAAVLTLVTLSVTAATGASAVGAAATTTTTTTTPTPTTTTVVGTPGPVGNAISQPPSVEIATQASEKGNKGVLITTNRPLISPGDPVLPGCPDTVDTNLGAGCFYRDPGDGSEWLQVLVLNRSDLSPASNVTPYNRTFDCPAATQYPNEATFDRVPGYGSACTKALSDFIGSLDSSDLVVAVSQPGRTSTAQPPVGVGAVLGGVGSNHGIGGSAKWYNSPGHGANINAARGTVSIVGVPGWKTGAVENESATPQVADSGHLEANVALDSSEPTQLYSPLEEASAEIETQSPITGILDRPSTPWPGDPNQLAAMAAIGTAVQLGAHPRAAFYSVGTGTNTAAYWTAKATAVRLLKPQDFPDIPKGDFDWARTNLAQEMDWVSDVDAYTDTLAMPYNGTGADLWAFFNYAQDAINNDTQNAAGAETTATLLEAVASILEVAGGFGHVLHTVSAAVVGAYHMVLAFSNVGRVEDEPFSTQAADLAREVTKRLNVTYETIKNQWRDIIVADYGKLHAVGTCTAREGKCANPRDNSEAWQIDSNDEKAMKSVIETGLQREIYEKLVPAKYPEAMQLNITTATNYDKNGGAGGWCPPLKPFGAGTGGYLYDQNVQSGFVRPIVLVSNNGDHPVSQKVLDDMFKPVGKGGVGMDERSFFERTYHIDKNYDPPRWVSAKYWARYTLCGWLSRG